MTAEVRSLRRHELAAVFMAGWMLGEARHDGTSWWSPAVFLAFAFAFRYFRRREEALS